MRHVFQIVAIRHGRTAWNADRRYQGHTDVPLDERGRAQARALGEMLATETFDLAVASDLARARETAQLVVERHGLALETDARWREMRFGEWEGLTWPEIVERHPSLAEAATNAPGFYTPSGGESFDELCTRVADALASIDERVRDGANVLVTTHAGPLHALLRVAVGESEAAALAVRFKPASVSRFEFGPSGGRIAQINVRLPEVAGS